jgi:hypothetical protein
MNLSINSNRYEALNNGIVVCGSGRSGTTILGMLIHSMKDIEYFFEPPLLIPLLLKKDMLGIQAFRELYEYYFFDQFFLDSIAARNVNMNKNDDSYIYHAKEEEDIKHRLSKSYRFEELIELSHDYKLAYKSPVVIFFLDYLHSIYPNMYSLIIHRNSNDIINSLLKKRWFNEKSLEPMSNVDLFSTSVVNNKKVPFWVDSNDIGFWLESCELDRCAYYSLKILENIYKNRHKAIIVDYDQFILHPKEVSHRICQLLGTNITQKTCKILDGVKPQEKIRTDFSSSINSGMLSKILALEERLTKICIDV